MNTRPRSLTLPPSIKGLLVVIALSGALWLLWLRYKQFLTQGRRPPLSSQILERLEKKGMPDFSLTDLDGDKISLSKYHDKVVILNFWASWCDPCVAEFPSLVKLVQHYKGRLVLIGVSADYSLSDIQLFLKTFKASHQPNVYIIWDKDEKLAKRYGTFRLPESYVIGPNGRLIRKIAGVENWASSDAYAFFDDLLLRSGHSRKPL